MVVLPDTTKVLTFDDRRHIYRLKGIELPSVTQVMKPLSDETYRSVEPRVLNRAADKGTAVHNAIENYISFGIEDIDPEFSGYFTAFLRWYQEFNVKPIASEYRLYHKFMGYAGTADLICDIGGQLHLVDYKTTQQIEEMLVKVQLKAYEKALDSLGVEPKKTAALHLKRDGTFDFLVLDGGAESWQVFSSLLTVLKYKQKYFGR